MQCHSRWFTLENTGQKKNLKNNTHTHTKHNPEKNKQCKTQQNSMT